MRSNAAAILAAVALTVMATGCRRTVPPPVPVEEYADFSAEAWKWADSVVATLTPRELAAQMVLPAMYASCGEADLRLLRMYADSLQIGGVMFLKGDVASARALADTLRSRSRIPPLVAIDAEWGLGMRLEEAPEFPVNGAVAPSVTDQTMYDYGREVARQSLLVGVNVVFGPVLDVAAVGSAIGRRSFGADPVRVAELGIAYARGLEDGGVMSVAKHFPGQGGAALDSHRVRPVISKSAAEFSAVDLRPFRMYVAANLSGIMVGHVSVPALDSVARSAVVSPVIMGKLLRDTIGFHGLVFTDAMNMRGLGHISYPVVKAVVAGADIVVAPAGTCSAVAELEKAIRSGRLPVYMARDRVRRILFYKYRLWIGDDGRPFGYHGPRGGSLPAALRSAQTVRIDSLLRNQSLPLSR